MFQDELIGGVTTMPYDLNGTSFSTKTNGILDLEINNIKPNYITKKRKIWFRMSPVQKTKRRRKLIGYVTCHKLSQFSDCCGRRRIEVNLLYYYIEDICIIGYFTQ